MINGRLVHSDNENDDNGIYGLSFIPNHSHVLVWEALTRQSTHDEGNEICVDHELDDPSYIAC